MTALAVCAGFLLTGCINKSIQHIEPHDATNLEREHLVDCLKSLTVKWPANEQIRLTSITRQSDKKHTVSVNFNLNMNQQELNRMASMGVKNQGYCEYEDGKLMVRNWMANIHDPDNIKVYMAMGKEDFR
jgi:hypothetical protein